MAEKVAKNQRNSVFGALPAVLTLKTIVWLGFLPLSTILNFSELSKAKLALVINKILMLIPLTSLQYPVWALWVPGSVIPQMYVQ